MPVFERVVVEVIIVCVFCDEQLDDPGDLWCPDCEEGVDPPAEAAGAAPPRLRRVESPQSPQSPAAPARRRAA